VDCSADVRTGEACVASRLPPCAWEALESERLRDALAPNYHLVQGVICRSLSDFGITVHCDHTLEFFGLSGANYDHTLEFFGLSGVNYDHTSGKFRQFGVIRGHASVV
jgi:hypothetical protein